MRWFGSCRFAVSAGGSLVKGGVSAFAAIVLAVFVLLAGVVVAMPVREAVADTSDYGPDGYFSALTDSAKPIIDNETNTPSSNTATGWANTRRIVFGKQKDATYTEAGTYAGASVSGGYKTLAKGKVGSVDKLSPFDNYISANPGYTNKLESATTSVAENEVLLWADDAVTANFKFDTNISGTNSFDSETSSYKSNLAQVSDAVGATNYSDFELGLLGAAQLEGVCTKAQTVGCKSGSYTEQQKSWNAYQVFPLSVGDLRQFAGTTTLMYQNKNDRNLACQSNTDNGGTSAKCANNAGGSWLRSAPWYFNSNAFYVAHNGDAGSNATNNSAVAGLRPAFRLQLDALLLSAHSGDQSQVLNAPNSATPDSLRLTFVDTDASVVLTSKPTIVQVSDGKWELKNLAGTSDLTDAEGHNVQSGLGWKLVDPEDVSGKVVASGRTNYDAAAKSAGNMVVPCETLTPDKDYVLSVWGQEDGSDTVGWSNRATKPVTGTVTADGDGVCALDIKTPVPYGISLTGQTSGTLTAYRIGEYDETVFTQSGALKSVRLDTPTALKDTLKAAAVAAGGADVDAGNPIGWVAARWLGYPTDPASDDVTSAFSPYAGRLQLFAKALADRVSADGDGVLGGVQGSLHGLDAPVDSPVTLPVSDEGLYLIVDSSGASLPIVVGTKVFNEALGGDGGFEDFADAGVKGKPRLGQAALKTTVTDIAKRIVNDAGLDGFDVGSSVEFEVALRVPDLSSFTSVAYDSYRFNLTDVAASGLTLPVDGSGVEVFVDALSPTEPQNDQLLPGLIAVSGDTLSVDGLKAVFAESDGVSGVKNKNTVPAGSLMRLRYRAVLNASAVVSSPVEGESLKPNANAVTLTRSRIGEVSNGWTDAGAGLESKAATANVYTFKLDVVKLDKDDLSTRLGGVEFEVSRAKQEGGSETLEFVGSDGVYRLAVDGETGSATVDTKADGTLSLQGVEARELSFKETTAPSGYFKVSDFTVDIRPVWNADATQITKVTYATSGTNLAYVSKDGEQVVVLDPAWSLANLPYTGGMGILVLLVVGGLMLMFAVRPYVLSKRAERDANLV